MLFDLTPLSSLHPVIINDPADDSLYASSSRGKEKRTSKESEAVIWLHCAVGEALSNVDELEGERASEPVSRAS